MARIGPVTPFGVAWDELELASVEAFLAESPDESLTWEAKGGIITPEHIRTSVSGFGNSELGGVLLLGATQDRHSRAWTLDHWKPREAEVGLWVSHCLGTGGVNPLPSTAIRSWDLEETGKLACIAVWPVAIPPVLTSSGQVWERTSSETVRVKDPTALRRLFERGKAAQDRVYHLSNEAADDLFTAGPANRKQTAVLAIGAVSVPSEVSALVFRQSFYQTILGRLRSIQGLAVPASFRPLVRAYGELNQGALTAWGTDGFGPDSGYSVRVGRHGSVAVGYYDPDVPSGAEWAPGGMDRLRRMWALGAEIAEELGAMGPTHVAARFTDQKLGMVTAAEWSETSSDGSDELERMIRDAQRAIGRMQWEPEA